MKYSANEVIQYIREEDIRFVELTFCDILGKQKSLVVTPHEIERGFDQGFPIDPTAITGFGLEGVNELYLRPDPSTLMLLPWRPESGSVIRMFGNITYSDGTPFENDSRGLLIRLCEAAELKGIHLELATSMEFYLFKNDEDGAPTNIPHDQAGYMDAAPLDKGENIRREIELHLERMGLVPGSSHHELGPGQNEIDFDGADPVTSADNAVTFTSVVHMVAAHNGLTADFSPRPVMEFPGSGMHVGISISSDDGTDHLDEAVAGILDKISEMTVFLDPTDNSYERLGRDKAPRYVSWSRGDRSHLVRIEPGGTKRGAELRSPDSSANPYLVHALIVAAALYGINHKLSLMPASDVNLYRAALNETDQLRSLPITLKQAREAALKSEFIEKVLPGSIIDFYCKKQG